MNQSILNKLSVKRPQLFCAAVVLSLLTAPSMAASWYTTHISPPAVSSWDCPFPKPNGAYDWADFSPFSPTAGTQTSPLLRASISTSKADVTYSFKWSRWQNPPEEIPPITRVDGYGIENGAILLALYVAYFNEHTPYSEVGFAGTHLIAEHDQLYGDMDVALSTTSNWYMDRVIRQIALASRISYDPATVDQLAAGLQAGSNFYLPCSFGGYFGGASSQIYTSTGFMGNIDVSGFTSLLLDGTVMIVRTNKLVWNSSRHAWKYGDDGIYIVKSITRSAFSIFGTTYSYTLYDVATGTTKVVTPQNESIKNIWSTGGISGSHTVAILDDGNPDYAEVIIDFAGLDPLVNSF